ncbi:MAG: Rieske (2Fe-2S) protein [Opitutales bacterium]
MARHVIGRPGEIAPGERKIVEIEGRRIGIFNVDGVFYALKDSCPHQGASLCSGKLTGAVKADRPGAYIFGRPGEIIRCPWHGWEFDIKTGRSWFDPRRVRTRCYPTDVVSGDPLEAGETEELQAETYPVSHDGEWLVVEV